MFEWMKMSFNAFGRKGSSKLNSSQEKLSQDTLQNDTSGDDYSKIQIQSSQQKHYPIMIKI